MLLPRALLSQNLLSSCMHCRLALVYLRSREEQAGWATCTCWGKDVKGEVKPDRKLRSEVLRESRLSLLLMA